MKLDWIALAVVCLVALVDGAAVGTSRLRAEASAKAESAIPVDPTPRIAYQYGPNGRFGIMALSTSGSSAAKRLTFSADGDTNMAVVKVDGKPLEFGGRAGRWLTSPQSKAGKSRLLSQATWVCLPSLYVTQVLEIVPSQQPVEVAPAKFKHLLDTCLVVYVLENRDQRSHEIGMRLEIDTLIGQNDGVPFTVPGLQGLVDRQRDFPDASRVPEFIQALEVPNLRNPGTIAHMNLKVGRGAEPPSRVSLTRWTSGFAGWNVPLQDMGRDSAIILYWGEKALKPREKRVLGFAYGLGAITSLEGKLGLTVSGAFEKGGSFAAVATLTNPEPGLTLTLVLPAELERIEGKDTEPVPAAGPKGTSLVTWRVRAQKVGQFQLEVRASNGSRAVQTIAIRELPLLLNPILKVKNR